MSGMCRVEDLGAERLVELFRIFAIIGLKIFLALIISLTQ